MGTIPPASRQRLTRPLANDGRGQSQAASFSKAGALSCAVAYPVHQRSAGGTHALLRGVAVGCAAQRDRDLVCRRAHGVRLAIRTYVAFGFSRTKRLLEVRLKPDATIVTEATIVNYPHAVCPITYQSAITLSGTPNNHATK